MEERTRDFAEFKLPRPRAVGMFILLIIIIIVLWGTFVIIPAGHRGVALWWGSVENRIMGEGLNFKVPIAEMSSRWMLRFNPIRSRRSMLLQENIRW
ncbi:MAG: hypothetical protein ACXU9W_09175 [Thermodesulfobacteriota bacterium]